jgi:hypothetical protein
MVFNRRTGGWFYEQKLDLLRLGGKVQQELEKYPLRQPAKRWQNASKLVS